MKIILTPQKWVSAILLFVFIAMYHNAKAQTGVTITVNGSVSGHTTTCTDGFATGSPDPEFEVRYDNVVTTNYGGDGDDGESTNCNNTGACSAPLVDGCGTVCGGGSLELYCPGATFDVKFRGFEDDLIDECVQAWITRTVTVNSTAAGAASVTAPTFSTPYANNGSTLTGIAYTVNTSGTFAPNNRDVTNKTCATAWTSTTKSSANPLLNNGTGAVVSGHSTDCGDAWYLYVLTDNNLSRLTFDATGDGNEAEVFYNCCGGTPLPDDVNLSGAYEIANPKPGNYYVRINTASLSSLPYIFTLNVSKTTGGARPANDDICNAIAIGGATLDYCEAPAGVAGTNVNSTNQDGCGVFEPQEDDGRTVWYKFTTNATQVGAQLRVKVEHTGGDAMAPDLSLFKLTGAAFTCATANPFSSLTLIAEDDGTSVVDRDAEFVISACSSLYEANKTYYLQIDDEGGLDGNGTFTVTIEDVGASVGPDNICSAYDLGTYAGTEPFCGPKTVRTDGGSEAGKLEINEQFRINSETNVCAGPQGSEPNSPNKTTWYKFTTGATVGTSVTVLVDAIDKSNAFGDLDAFVSVHSNCSACTFGDLTEVADCGLCFSSGPDDASVSFTPKPNTTYYIQVDGYNPVLGVGGGPIGVYDVQVTMNNTPRVANDDICNAVTLTVPTATCGTNPTTSANVSGTTVGASSQDKCTVNEPGADLTDQTVWYKFTMGADVPREIIVNVDQTSCNDIGVLNIIGPTIYELNGATFTCVTANPFSSLGSPAIADAPNGVDYSQARLECPIPGKTYYVQVQGRTIDECEQGTFTINLEIPDVLLGPDKICNAFDLGILSNTTNVDLVKTCQTNSCATIVGTEPDNTGLSDLDKTVWYRFTTPPAYYADGSLAHLYNIQVDRRGSSPSTTVPDIYLYKESAATVRTCTPENAASFANLQFVGTDAGNAVPLLETGAEIEYLCLEAATTYYIQVDHLGLGSYVDFDVRVKKSAFRPGNDLCSATDLGVYNLVGDASWTMANKFTASPYFNLPHSNKCASSQVSEPEVTNGVPTWPNPPYTGDPSEMNGTNHTATVWYKFTMPTSGAMPDFIEWFNNDGGNGNRGTVCLTWDSEVLIYQSTSGACSFADATFVPIVEKDRPGNTCTAIIQCTGSNDQFLLSCPTAGATYYVQVGDASNSTCYEGLWTIDKIHRPAANATPPTNDEPCGAINLGTIPNGGAYNSTGVHFNNFCATANQEFRADFTQPLEKDVWFAFRPPASGSVRITAASAPSGAPASSDDDIDLQIAVWDPVLGTNSIAGHCADPRYLWAPLISQDHDIIEAGEAGNILPTYYDIYNANGDGLLSQEANEGNELIVTCLDPNKFYFIQVDGGLYGLETTPVLNLTSCDGINGDCVEGYFSLQVTDAGIYDLTHIPTTANPISADEPCFAYELPVQAAGSYDANTITYKKGSNICATATNDPIPPCWNGANNTVWYKFVAPSVGRVKIYAKELQDNNFEPRIPGGVASDHDYHDDMNLQLAVYDQVSGSCLNKAGLSLITCDYDGATLESTPSIVGVQNDDYVAFPTDGFDEYTLVKCLIPGHTYYVMVDGENDPNLGLGANTEDVVGNFQIAIEAVGTIPASTNDDVCDAYDMVGTQSHVAGSSALRFPATGHFNNECATIETFEQSGGIADDIDDDDNIPVFSLTNIVEHTLWFKFKAPASGKVEIRAINAGTGDDIDLAMAIYDFPSATCATASAGLTITEEYDGPASDEDLDAECLIPGRYYYLQVDGDANSACDLILPSNCETGDFYLEFEALPVQPRADIAPQLNDDICDAKNLGTLVNGTNITRNNDNNRCATQELDEPATGGTNLSVFADQDRTVWYRFTTSANPGPLYIRANDPVSATTLDLDIDLYEYDGTYIYAPCITSNVFNNLIRVGEGDILICGLTPNCEDLTLNCPKPSTTYFLQVTGSASVLGLGFGGDQGTFDILVSPSATPNATLANDNICSSTVLGSLASGATLSRTNQNNFCATQELDEPNTDQGCLADQDCAEETVWYSFTTGATPGVISVLVDGINTGVSDFYPYVTLYRAPSTSYNACTSDFTGIVDVAADGLIINPITHDASVDIPCPTPNTKYYIQVDGLDGVAGIPNDEGTFNLSVIDDGSGSARPVNDNLVNTINLGTLAAGAAIATTGHNFCASAETNEPNTQYGGNETTNHDNSNEDETVWYKFKTSLAPGLITINVNDDAAFPEAFTSGFTLYYNNGTAPNYRITGAPSSTLIQEGSSNTGILGTSGGTYMCLLPNTEYYIQVDGTDNIPLRTDQG